MPYTDPAVGYTGRTLYLAGKQHLEAVLSRDGTAQLDVVLAVGHVGDKALQSARVEGQGSQKLGHLTGPTDLERLVAQDDDCAQREVWAVQHRHAVISGTHGLQLDAVRSARDARRVLAQRNEEQPLPGPGQATWVTLTRRRSGVQRGRCRARDTSCTDGTAGGAPRSRWWRGVGGGVGGGGRPLEGAGSDQRRPTDDRAVEVATGKPKGVLCHQGGRRTAQSEDGCSKYEITPRESACGYIRI